MSYNHFCQFKTALLYQSKAASFRMIRKPSTSTLYHSRSSNQAWSRTAGTELCRRTRHTGQNHIQRCPCQIHRIQIQCVLSVHPARLPADGKILRSNQRYGCIRNWPEHNCWLYKWIRGETFAQDRSKHIQPTLCGHTPANTGCIMSCYYAPKRNLTILYSKGRRTAIIAFLCKNSKLWSIRCMFIKQW